MLEKKIVFLPYKLHFRYFLFMLAEKMSLTVFLPPEKSLPEGSRLRGVPIVYKQFGADFIKSLVSKEIRTLKYVTGLHKLLDEQECDILITCEFYHWYTLQCISYKRRHPNLKLFVISETKQWPRNPVVRLFKRMLWHLFKLNLKHVDNIIVYTQAAKEFLEKYAPGKRVTLLPTPINTEMFKPKVSTEKQFYADGQLRLLMNARYSSYKRHKDLFEALVQLCSKGRNVRLTCISRDEKSKENIVALAEKMGVIDMINFLDPLPLEQMPGLFYSHDVLILPSYNEAIGMVVPEAMACGLPTVTSDTIGANVYVKEGKTGFIFKTGDVEELVRTIEKCFDSDLLEYMGAAAHKRIEKFFTPDVIVAKFEEILNS